jgi:DNA primase
MPRIPDDDIQRVKQGTDLAALIRSRGVELKKHGTKDVIGRCPFHDDRDTPNLIVSPDKGLYHCMSCGAAGNAIQFVQRFDGISFRHAFELLRDGGAAAFAGGAEPTKHSRVPRLQAPVDFSAEDHALIAQVLDYYNERLWKNPQALAYLRKRGLDDEALLKRLRVGFADRTLGLRLPPKDRKDGAAIRERLTRLGIYRDTGHEHFNGCVVVPIFESGPDGRMGNVSELYGRRLDDGGKSGIKHLYLPGPHRGIFHPSALDSEEVILCESILDSMTFLAAGIENVTCIYGTEGFTEELFAALQRRKVLRVKLAYDADDPGERAATRDTERLKAAGMEVWRIKFPWGMDANEYARGQSDAASALRSVIQQAEWCGGVPAASRAPSSSLAADVSSPDAAKEGKVEVAACLEERAEHHVLHVEGREYRLAGLAKCSGLDSLKVTLRLKHGERMHSDQIDLCRDLDRKRFADRAADEIGLTNELVKRDVARVLLACEQWLEKRWQEQQAPKQGATVPTMSDVEREEALELLRDPKLVERITGAFGKCGVVGEDVNLLTGYLVATSRKLDKPLGVIIQSSSAAGKSTLMDAVLNFFPEEDRIKYSAMTGQSLYYLGETNLKHKALAIVEEAGAERASYALKLLLSEGELTIASTGKDPHTGRMETQLYRVEGPCALLLTTTAIDIDEELQNRCLVLTVDESPEQTARIHTAQRRARSIEGLLEKEERAETLRVLRNAQRLLTPVRVFNPYAEALTFPSGRTRTRRDHEKYHALIETIALLHQHQRPLEKIGNGRREIEVLRVRPEDIALANKLAAEVLARSLDELPPQTRKLWDHIRQWIEQRHKTGLKASTFSRRELRERCGWSVTQVRVHLERLLELEYLVLRHGRAGVPMVYEPLVEVTENRAAVVSIALLDAAKLPTTTPHLTGKKAA